MSDTMTHEEHAPRRATSAYAPRSHTDGGEPQEQPPRRANSALQQGEQREGSKPPSRSNSTLRTARVTRTKREVRTGLLARIFFPHFTRHTEHDDGVTRSSKPGTTRRASVLQPGGALSQSTEPLGDEKAAPGSSTLVSPDEETIKRPLTVSEKIAEAIQGSKVQTFFLVLLVLDVFFVIAEVLILAHVSIHYHLPHPEHEAHESSLEPSALEAVPSSHSGFAPLAYERQRRRQDAGLSIPAYCANATLREYPVPEEEREGTGSVYWVVEPAGCPVMVFQQLTPPLHRAEIAMQWCSRIVLWFFGVELIILAACLRMGFITHPMYMLDFVIVYVSIGFDIYFWAAAVEEPEIGLIIITRCWRFARILHGVGQSIHEVDEIEFEHHHQDKDGNHVVETTVVSVDQSGNVAARHAGTETASPGEEEPRVNPS
jgi:hypothetical protein